MFTRQVYKEMRMIFFMLDIAPNVPQLQTLTFWTARVSFWYEICMNWRSQQAQQILYEIYVPLYVASHIQWIDRSILRIFGRYVAVRLVDSDRTIFTLRRFMLGVGGREVRNDEASCDTDGSPERHSLVQNIARQLLCLSPPLYPTLLQGTARHGAHGLLDHWQWRMNSVHLCARVFLNEIISHKKCVIQNADILILIDRDIGG